MHRRRMDHPAFRVPFSYTMNCHRAQSESTRVDKERNVWNQEISPNRFTGPGKSVQENAASIERAIISRWISLVPS